MVKPVLELILFLKWKGCPWFQTLSLQKCLYCNQWHRIYPAISLGRHNIIFRQRKWQTSLNCDRKSVFLNSSGVGIHTTSKTSTFSYHLESDYCKDFNKYVSLKINAFEYITSNLSIFSKYEVLTVVMICA